MPHQLALEFGLLNAVAAFAGAVAAIRTEEGLAVTSGRKPKSASDDGFGQRVHVVENIHKNHQLSFFQGKFKRLKPPTNPKLFLFSGENP